LLLLIGDFGAWCKDGATFYTGNFDDGKPNCLSILARDDLDAFGNITYSQ
jgi:hypothetical protein